LEHLEALAVQAHPLLAVEDGPGGHELEGRGDREHRGRGEDQCPAADDEVEHALRHAIPAVERGLAQVDERDRLELLDASAERREAKVMIAMRTSTPSVEAMATRNHSERCEPRRLGRYRSNAWNAKPHTTRMGRSWSA